MNESTSAFILDVWLRMANLRYYLEHMQPKQTKKGDLAECSECHCEQPIFYMYGGKYPMCRDCCTRVLN